MYIHLCFYLLDCSFSFYTIKSCGQVNTIFYVDSGKWKGVRYIYCGLPFLTLIKNKNCSYLKMTSVEGSSKGYLSLCFRSLFFIFLCLMLLLIKNGLIKPQIEFSLVGYTSWFTLDWLLCRDLFRNTLGRKIILQNCDFSCQQNWTSTVLVSLLKMFFFLGKTSCMGYVLYF